MGSKYPLGLFPGCAVVWTLTFNADLYYFQAMLSHKTLSFNKILDRSSVYKSENVAVL